MKKIIHIELLPNFEEDDFEIIETLNKTQASNIYNIYKEKITIFLKQIFPQGNFFFFKTARSALTAILLFLKEKLNSNKEEIYTQAFTCLVVPNAIQFANLKPVFVDIKKRTANMNLEDLNNKINKEKGLAIIVQNTFGIPDEIKNIIEIAKVNNLYVIENLAHAFGARFQGKFLGNFGDFAIVSFDNTKTISSLLGGLLVINRQDLVDEFNKFYERLEECSLKEVKVKIKYALVLKKIKKYYHPVGKTLIYLAKKLNLTPKLIQNQEMEGLMPKNYMAKFPPLLYPLLWNQVKKIFRFNEHRKKIASLYLKHGFIFLGEAERKNDAIFLRYPITTYYKQEILTKLKRKGIYLGDWYSSVLAPVNYNLEKFGYQPRSCREAEKLINVSLNLPTHINISEEDVERIVTEIYENLRS